MKSGSASINHMWKPALGISILMMVFVVADTFIKSELADRRCADFTYWVLSFLTIALFIRIGLLAARNIEWLRANRKIFLVSVLFSSALIFVSNANSISELRIFDDATDRLGVAVSFEHSQKYLRIHSGTWEDNGSAVPFYQTRPSRSPYYPYLLSLINTVAGYRVSNAFLLNWILLACIMNIGGVFLGRRFGFPGIICFQLAIVSQPLLIHTAASLCYELLASLLIMMSLLAGHRYMISRSSDSANILILSIAGLMYSRAEMIIYGPFLMIVFMILSRSVIYSRCSPADIVASFSVITVVCLQRIGFKGMYPGAKLSSTSGGSFEEVGLLDAPIGLLIKTANFFWLFIRSSFDLWSPEPTNGILAYSTAGLVLIWLVYSVTGGRRLKWSVLPVPALLFLSAYILGLCALTWNITSPNTARYFCPAAIALAFAFSFFGNKVINARISVSFIVTVAMVCYFFGLPKIMSDRFFSPGGDLTMYYRQVTDFLTPKMNSRTIILSESPGRFFINRWNSFHYYEWDKHKNQIIKKMGRLPEKIYVAQRTDRNLNRPWSKSSTIPFKHKMKTVYTASTGRISGMKIYEFTPEAE